MKKYLRRSSNSSSSSSSSNSNGRWSSRWRWSPRSAASAATCLSACWWACAGAPAACSAACWSPAGRPWPQRGRSGRPTATAGGSAPGASCTPERDSRPSGRPGRPWACWRRHLQVNPTNNVGGWGEEVYQVSVCLPNDRIKVLR